MWAIYIALLFVSMTLIMIGWQGWMGKLPRQHFAGIRTPYSMANDEQWKAVHRYGSPYLIFGGVAAFAAALAMLPFAIAGALPSGFVLATVIAIGAVLLGTALLSWRKGVTGAKAELGH
ncbi:MAG: SdpI family protein [Dehalococcoidia bacterium]